MTRRDVAQKAVERLRAISLDGCVGVFDVVVRRVIEEAMAEHEKPLIEMLQQLEFSAKRIITWDTAEGEDSHEMACCISCVESQSEGHQKGCKLDALLKETIQITGWIGGGEGQMSTESAREHLEMIGRCKEGHDTRHLESVIDEVERLKAELRDYKALAPLCEEHLRELCRLSYQGQKSEAARRAEIAEGGNMNQKITYKTHLKIVAGIFAVIAILFILAAYVGCQENPFPQNPAPWQTTLLNGL